MKYIFAFIFSLSIFISMSNAQGYYWVLKQSGYSLGGPIDYNDINTNIVYFGSASTIYKSTDRGETFSVAGTNLPGSSAIKCVILDNNNPGTLLVAIESTPNDKIYKTTNDGLNWTLTLDEGQMSYYGIPVEQDPTHPDNIYTMINTNFKKSTDFGSTWTTISSNFGPANAPCDIEVFPDTSIILIGDNGTGIFKSTDYGLTWSQKYYTSGEIPTVSVDNTHPGVAWATKWSGGGGLLRSSDYGETWTLQSTFNGISMWGVNVQPSDGNVVIANSYSTAPGSWRTINGGLSWTPISIPSQGYQVVSIDSMTQFAAQGNGFYKLDAPWFVPVELTSFTAQVVGNDVILNWSTATEINNQGFDIEFSPDNENFTKIGFVPGFGTTTEMKSYSYTVSDVKSGVQYYRIKQIDFDGTSTAYNSVEVTGPLPGDFVLNQNYPNPFNPSTTISFSLPVEANVNIKVFNMIGQEVAEITKGNFEAGSHNLQFNAAKLSSGTYIYKLEANAVNGANFTSTKKMIILK